MEKVPIVNESLKLDAAVSGNFKPKEKPYYIKVFSELYDRDWDVSIGFVDGKEGVKEAEHFARKYQDLVDVGFYPPKTQFIVARDGLEFITVMAIMPELEPAEWCPNLEGDISKLRKKAAKVLGVKEEALSNDTEYECNYGLLDGKVYCFDLHVLDFNKILKNGNKYRTMPWI